ncbi:hypothetical protein EWM64_g9325 [Hericium alpestre]|uniref:Cupin type-1 domain-containing protein n=1 Tax=Hericium alpestre TaxID=135208 RepID=A0A4Y9ZKW0_9AGAM|nr:hypothetical protein EWM64_g9325 [Hericium alpestre]
MPSKPQPFYLNPTPLVPNSPYPLLVYRDAFPKDVGPDAIAARFEQNAWIRQWTYGMYDRSHYHSTTHEALGIFRGSALLKFGIADGEAEEPCSAVQLEVHAGDAIIIPAGVAHRAVRDTGGFMMVGAYPRGSKQWDMNYGGENKPVVSSVPDADPVLGQDPGGLIDLWAM